MKPKIINLGNLPIIDHKIKGLQVKKLSGTHKQNTDQTDANQLIAYINQFLTRKRCVIPVDDMLKRSIHFLSKIQNPRNLNSLISPLKASPIKKQQNIEGLYKYNKPQVNTTLANGLQHKINSNFKDNANLSLTSSQNWQLNRKTLEQTEQALNQQPMIKKIPTIQIIKKLKNIIANKDNKIGYLKQKIQQLNVSINQLKKIVQENQNKLLNQNDQLQHLSKQLEQKFKPIVQVSYPITIQEHNFPIFLEYPINLSQQTKPSVKDFYEYGQQTSQMYIDNNTLKQQIQRIEKQHQYLWMYVHQKTEENDFY